MKKDIAALYCLIFPIAVLVLSLVTGLFVEFFDEIVNVLKKYMSIGEFLIFVILTVIWLVCLHAVNSDDYD